MRQLATRSTLSLVALVTLFGCMESPTEQDPLEQATLPLTSVCADAAGLYFVDGIPAYAQCAASNNAAIYSNNGIDTATSAISSDWKRTQFSGGYQCTELVHRYWLFRWNVTWIPNGNAGTWCDATPPEASGITKTTVPVHGDAIVFAPGVCGAAASTGHVALVDTVDASGSKVTIVEENNAGRRSAAVTCASCFLHVVANTGTAGTGGASSSGGASTSGASTGGASTGGASTSRPAAGGAVTQGFGGAGTGGASTSRPAAGGAVTQGFGGASNGGATASAVGGSVSGGAMGTSLGNGGSSMAAPTTSAPAAGGESTSPASTLPTTVAGGAPGNPSSTGLGGATAVAATDVADAADADAGCSCNVPARRPARSLALGLLAAAVLGLRRKRQPR